jgi:hypothetical protein
MSNISNSKQDHVSPSLLKLLLVLVVASLVLNLVQVTRPPIIYQLVHTEDAADIIDKANKQHTQAVEAYESEKTARDVISPNGAAAQIWDEAERMAIEEASQPMPTPAEMEARTAAALETINAAREQSQLQAQAALERAERVGEALANR